MTTGTLPGMSKISVIAKLTAADGKADDLQSAMRGVIDAAQIVPFEG